MGVFKKFKNAIAFESIATVNGEFLSADFSLPMAWVDVNGTSRSTIFTKNLNGANAYNAISPLGNIIPFVSEDTLDDYSYTDYVEDSISDVVTSQTCSNASTINGARKIISLSIKNNSSDSVVVRCIKFKKHIAYGTSYGTSGYNTNWTHTLICAYYLDEDEYITIAPGDSEQRTIMFEVGTDVSVNET